MTHRSSGSSKSISVPKQDSRSSASVQTVPETIALTKVSSEESVTIRSPCYDSRTGLSAHLPTSQTRIQIEAAAQPSTSACRGTSCIPDIPTPLQQKLARCLQQIRTNKMKTWEIDLHIFNFISELPTQSLCCGEVAPLLCCVSLFRKVDLLVALHTKVEDPIRLKSILQADGQLLEYQRLEIWQNVTADLLPSPKPIRDLSHAFQYPIPMIPFA